MYFTFQTRAVWPGAERGRENIELPGTYKGKFFVCICQTDIWGKTEKVGRSLKQCSFLFQDRGITCIPRRAPHHSMWKCLYPGQIRGCSPCCSPALCWAESAFWSFPECDNYRKSHSSALWTSSRSFILLIFPWKIETFANITVNTSFFRKV